MRAGKLSQLATIQAPTQTQDNNGDLQESWGTFNGMDRIGVEVQEGTGGEYFAARQIQADRTAVIRTYPIDGVLPTMRIIHHYKPDQDIYYDIVGVTKTQDGARMLTLYCRWREAEGYRRGVDLSNPETVS